MPRLLIVEDERDLAECLGSFFTSRGFAVESVFSGEEAVERLQGDRVDVILLDILLPGLSGLEVLKHVKRVTPETTVVMVTSVDHRDVRETAHRFGAAAYITKPFDFSESTWSPVLRQLP